MDLIKAIIKEPHMQPEILSVDPKEISLKTVLGGQIGGLQLPNDNAVLVYDKDGVYKNKEINLLIYGSDGQMLQFIVGTLLLCGYGENGFCSLSDAQVKEYMNRLAS